MLAAPDLTGGGALAVVEVLLVALCYASAPLIAARKLADVPSLPMTVSCLSLAAVVYLPGRSCPGHSTCHRAACLAR